MNIPADDLHKDIIKGNNVSHKCTYMLQSGGKRLGIWKAVLLIVGSIVGGGLVALPKSLKQAGEFALLPHADHPHVTP